MVAHEAVSRSSPESLGSKLHESPTQVERRAMGTSLLLRRFKLVGSPVDPQRDLVIERLSYENLV